MYFRSRNLAKLNPNQIRQFLEDVPSDSDISGASDDSRGDEDWVPLRDRDEPDSDPDDPADNDVGPDGDGGGDALDRDLADLDVSDIPSTPTTSAEPLYQKGSQLLCPLSHCLILFFLFVSGSQSDILFFSEKLIFFLDISIIPYQSYFFGL